MVPNRERCDSCLTVWAVESIRFVKNPIVVIITQSYFDSVVVDDICECIGSMHSACHTDTAIVHTGTLSSEGYSSHANWLVHIPVHSTHDSYLYNLLLCN